jgi:hypothetical protein
MGVHQRFCVNFLFLKTINGTEVASVNLSPVYAGGVVESWGSDGTFIYGKSSASSLSIVVYKEGSQVDRWLQADQKPCDPGHLIP